jgi:Putative prokaryotic signal transducing protein
MSMQEMVTVYTVSNAIEAEIIKNALIDEGIHCEIEGSHQAGEAGLTGIEIKLQVPEADALRAKAFIADHDSLAEDEPVDDEHAEGIQPI